MWIQRDPGRYQCAKIKRPTPRFLFLFCFFSVNQAEQGVSVQASARPSVFEGDKRQRKAGVKLIDFFPADLDVEPNVLK